MDVLDEMEKETSERQDFEAMSLGYYKDLYHFYGKSHIETVLSYLDLDAYAIKMQSEFDKTSKDIEKTKAFLEKNPGNEKKEIWTSNRISSWF